MQKQKNHSERVDERRREEEAFAFMHPLGLFFFFQIPRLPMLFDAPSPPYRFFVLRFLAGLLIAGVPDSAVQSMDEQIAERTIYLKEKVPVHLQYWTAWAERDGIVYFRRDIYTRDEPLARALPEAVPPMAGR